MPRTFHPRPSCDSHLPDGAPENLQGPLAAEQDLNFTRLRQYGDLMP